MDRYLIEWASKKSPYHFGYQSKDARLARDPDVAKDGV